MKMRAFTLGVDLRADLPADKQSWGGWSPAVDGGVARREVRLDEFVNLVSGLSDPNFLGTVSGSGR